MLKFVDGFDHYATAQIVEKWNAVGGYGTGTIVTGAGVPRNGVGCFEMATMRGSLRKTVTPGHATIVLGFAIRPAALVEATQFITFKGATLRHVMLSMRNTGVIQVYRGSVGFSFTGATLLGQTASGALVAGSWQFLEVKVVLHDTAGSVVIRIDGVTVLTLTNVDTSMGTDTTIDSFVIGMHDDSADNPSTTVTLRIDDLYVLDGSGATNIDFLGDVKVDTLLPTAAGATTQFTPSAGLNYAAVDEPATNTTDYVTSSAVNQIDTYAMSNLVSAGGSIKGVQVAAYALKTDAGVQNIEPILRVGAVDYPQGAQTLALGSWQYKTDQSDVSPATGVAWTVAEVNALEAGFASRS